MTLALGTSEKNRGSIILLKRLLLSFTTVSVSPKISEKRYYFMRSHGFIIRSDTDHDERL